MSERLRAPTMRLGALSPQSLPASPAPSSVATMADDFVSESGSLDSTLVAYAHQPAQATVPFPHKLCSPSGGPTAAPASVRRRRGSNASTPRTPTPRATAAAKAKSSASTQKGKAKARAKGKASAKAAKATPQRGATAKAKSAKAKAKARPAPRRPRRHPTLSAAASRRPGDTPTQRRQRITAALRRPAAAVPSMGPAIALHNRDRPDPAQNQLQFPNDEVALGNCPAVLVTSPVRNTVHAFVRMPPNLKAIQSQVGPDGKFVRIQLTRTNAAA